MSDSILLEKKDNIALITINRPPANSWNIKAMKGLEKALDDIETDDSIRVVIITGSGEKCFSAGFDVSDPENAKKTADLGRVLWKRLDQFHKPTIAAINGHALGGGLELALCCHFRIMALSDKAKLGLTELNLGIIPGWGGTQRLMRLTGRSKALEMILLSKRISAEEALEAGIINETVPAADLMERAVGLSKDLCAKPPLAVAAVLRSVNAGLYSGIDAGLEMEAVLSRSVEKSRDAVEGFTAFLEKRKPVFRGE
ncbi:MAG: enoyl-CoA hydratase-related protein [Desulfobacteraceae bacterium]